MAETLFSSPTLAQTRQSPPADDTAAFYVWLAARPDDEAEGAMLRTLLRELRLEPDALHAAVHARYRGWLRLTQEQGARIAAAYDRARDQLSPEQQIALDEAEQDVVRHGLSYRDFEHLSQFVPWLRAWYVPPALERLAFGPPSPFGLALAMLR